VSARVLLIEDNQDNRDLMVYLFQAFGYDPLIARDGEEGLTAARRDRPDLIVCDIQIPCLDGYEVARQLKRDGQLRSIPLIAVTAYAMVGDRDKMLAAGFDGYIAKPINAETFVDEIEEFLTVPLRSPEPRPAPVATPPAAAEALPKLSRGKVLVVDNLPSKRYLLRSILEPSQYEVLEADGVDEALALARQTRPDLILTDVHMPEKSGFDLVRELLVDPQIRRIPVLIHTATSVRGEEAKQFESSDTCFVLQSPLEPEKLLKRVHAILHGKESG
jgi:two-component system cell cycle response regulator